MGYITPEITGKFPGYLSPSAGLKFADVPNGLAAISKVPAAGWGQILAYMAFCEVSQDQSAGTPAAAGDFGFKVLTASDPEAKKTKLAAELANGRLAMMAIIGMFFQDPRMQRVRVILLHGYTWSMWTRSISMQDSRHFVACSRSLLFCATTSFLYEETPLQQSVMFGGRTHLQRTVQAKQIEYCEAEVFPVPDKESRQSLT